MASNGSKPTFDFSRVTKRWISSWRQNSVELDQWNRVATEEGRDDLTADELRKLNSAKAQALGEINRLISERDQLVAKTVRSIPRDWLDPEAPENLDWSDPESLGWLLADKEIELLNAMGEARTQDSKN